MRNFIYTIIVILFVVTTPLVADEEAGEPPTKTQEQLMELGFQVFREPVEAPDFTLKDLNGDDVSLSSFKGKFVFLNFWATWCGPCRVEMPSMQTMYDTLKGYDFEILAVDLQESERTVKKFIQDAEFTFPVVLDRNGRVGADYGARSIPTTYLINTEGYAIGFLIGSRRWDEDGVYETFKNQLSIKAASN
ncbi:MAG: hypothetical protein CMN78_05435 [Spirochaetales bacterium]|nr:hypothetical protein [Spirochaetales bacterium]